MVLSVGGTEAFTPTSRQRTTTTTRLRAADLPSYSQYTSVANTNNIETIGAIRSPISDVVPPSDIGQALQTIKDAIADSSSLLPHVQFSDIFGTSTPVGLEADPQLVNDIIANALTPWHVGAFLAFFAGASIVKWLDGPEDFSTAPFEPGTDTYSPQKSDEFYSTRGFMVAKRILKLGLLSGGFNVGILWDWLVLGRLLKDDDYTALKKAEPERAKIALVLCEQLGPTFIKLGQALSIRTDLVPEAYALELRQLQDAVSPFDSLQAYEILRKEMGVRDLSSVFSTLSPEPIASASIGQVYRGTLASNGKDVAVKVQRPGILSEIALDLHILRILTPLQTTLQNAVNGIKTTQDDIDTAISLVDEWGRGFVAETDYRLEAENTKTFEAAMRKRGLDAVCAPAVVTDLVRDKVLVTEWVVGTRLDTDKSPDVPRLCGVAINAYLTMLLDTGVLHCDPHPGNLLRTTDGRLCILDWGMTLNVPNDLQYALLEFIAHINVEDYDAIPEDFINLGFSPPDVTPERLKNSGITEGISFAFRQLSGGGGPKKIQERVKAEFQERYGGDLTDEELQKAAQAEMMTRMEDQLASEGVDVKGVTNVMEEMSRRNRELFKLPPYVLYVARAFSTLEGIGLSIDEDYAIVQECYPYLSRRLFTDRNPRAKKALRAMLGLGELADDSSALATVGDNTASPPPSKGLSTAKLLEMSEGFTSYTAATADVDRDGKGQAAAVAEFSKLFLDPKGSTLQDILVDETAKFGDAVARSALRSALVDNPAAKAAAAAFRAPKENNEALYDALPGLIQGALEFPDLLEELTSTTAEDERILTNARDLGDILGPRLFNNDGGDDDESSGENVSAFDAVRSSLAGQLSDGALGVPQSSSFGVPSLPSVFTDEATRKTVTDQLPGVATLGRRIGAGLFKRAAYRTEQSLLLPEAARRVLVEANTVLAEVIEPTMEESQDDL